MKELALTRGMIALVDEDVFEWACHYKWHASSGHAGKWYAARGIIVDGGGTTEYLHHRVMSAEKGQEVDHKDGNSLNDCWENLRIVAHQQNQQNQPFLRVDNSTGFRGVTFHRQRGKYAAQVSTYRDGKREHYSFGLYLTAEEADVAARNGRLLLMTHSDGR